MRQRTVLGGGAEKPIHRQDFLSKDDLKSSYTGFHGVIIRSNRWVMPNGSVRESGFYSPITFAKITDGSSKTLVLGEKFLRPSLYQEGDWHDDRGWSDGWDPDTLRCTICRIMQDRELNNSSENRTAGFRFGSAHVSGMNAAFADGSVRTIDYDIDQELFNLMANRKDGDLGGKELTEVAPR